ncbi:MAG: hypothetical protein QOH65_1844 [Methylobacteriaceae bacterium]|jgi:hypothetical protein|nr:hypothetical protein [Methylobacteriaceae bacterium]
MDCSAAEKLMHVGAVYLTCSRAGLALWWPLNEGEKQ